MITQNEAIPELVFSPSCITCPNRSVSCAQNFDEVLENFGEAAIGLPVTPKHHVHQKEAA